MTLMCIYCSCCCDGLLRRDRRYPSLNVKYDSLSAMNENRDATELHYRAATDSCSHSCYRCFDEVSLKIGGSI